MANTAFALSAQFQLLSCFGSNGSFRKTNFLSRMSAFGAFPDQPLLFSIQSFRMTETGWFAEWQLSGKVGQERTLIQLLGSQNHDCQARGN
jgi:hypothetical protein